MKKVSLFVKCTSLQSLGYNDVDMEQERLTSCSYPTPNSKRKSSETVGPALFSNKRVGERGVAGAFCHTKKHGQPSQAHLKAVTSLLTN